VYVLVSFILIFGCFLYSLSFLKITLIPTASERKVRGNWQETLGLKVFMEGHYISRLSQLERVPGSLASSEDCGWATWGGSH
jgi:hypothetical protein